MIEDTKEQQDSENTNHFLLQDRRKKWRFLAPYRVTYEINGRFITAFTTNLSNGGMRLHSATSLNLEDEIIFSLHLGHQNSPIKIKGKVVAKEGLNNQEVSIAFIPENAEYHQELNDFIDNHLIPKLENFLKNNQPTAACIIDLAGLYYDRERYDEAFNLYKLGLDHNKRDIALYQHISLFLYKRIKTLGINAYPLIKELAKILENGLKICKQDELLKDIEKEVNLIKQSLEQQKEIEFTKHLENRLNNEIKKNLAEKEQALLIANERIKELEETLADNPKNSPKNFNNSDKNENLSDKRLIHELKQLQKQAEETITTLNQELKEKSNTINHLQTMIKDNDLDMQSEVSEKKGLSQIIEEQNIQIDLLKNEINTLEKRLTELGNKDKLKDEAKNSLEIKGKELNPLSKTDDNQLLAKNLTNLRIQLEHEKNKLAITQKQLEIDKNKTLAEKLQLKTFESEIRTRHAELEDYERRLSRKEKSLAKLSNFHNEDKPVKKFNKPLYYLLFILLALNLTLGFILVSKYVSPKNFGKIVSSKA